MYEGGQGVKQDYAESLKWWRKLADEGDKSGAEAVTEPLKQRPHRTGAPPIFISGNTLGGKPATSHQGPRHAAQPPLPAPRGRRYKRGRGPSRESGRSELARRHRTLIHISSRRVKRYRYPRGAVSRLLDEEFATTRVATFDRPRGAASKTACCVRSTRPAKKLFVDWAGTTMNWN